MKRVIITGGEGFIGRALSAELCRRGVSWVIVDRRNCREAGDYFTGLDLSGIDCVFHLAAQTSVFNENKTDIIRDNIDAFRIVCDTCFRHGVKLVYASSSTANGSNTTSLYGISKRFDEEYARCYNPQATGVRLHNVYGPNPRQGTLLWHLLHKERVKLYNGGRNARHFTWIGDIVEALIMAASEDRALVNAANPQLTTTFELAEMVRRYKPLEIELIEQERDFDRKEQEVNNEVYTLPLQYTGVEEGIRRVFKADKWQGAR